MSEAPAGIPQEILDLIASRDEELHPDLEPWLEETDFGPMLKHPLVYDISGLHGHANARYERKQAHLAEALAEEDWYTVVFLHERPYRFWALTEYVPGVMDLETAHGECLRELIMDVWIDSENIHENYAEWMDVLAVLADDPFTDDPEGFADLPDLIEVWRGGTEPGLSWSTDKSQAEWFAARFKRPGTQVFHGWVGKAAVAGYLIGRGESEIVVPDPEVVSLEEA